MNDISTKKLEEKVVIFLYVISENKDRINQNTFRRYIYLYYLTISFLDSSKRTEPISIVIEKGDVTIIDYDSIIDDLKTRGFIEMEESDIIIKTPLIDFIEPYIQNQNGVLFDQYKGIKPFVSLLQSYNDQFVFTIFFNEPTFSKASLRGLDQIQSSNSKLKTLLKKFKEKIVNTKIDEYDVLAYWMDFILKNYYIESESGDEE